ncbi:MAG: beta-glycosidase, partial [Tannerellaceae bacterium]|nr:beta-glycosidase [Tannerellaceae bacterium]
TLTGLPKTIPVIKTSLDQTGDSYTGTVQIQSDNGISFFNRIKVLDKKTGKRILPVHYSDNYVTLMPGDKREIILEFTSALSKDQIEIVIDSWTADRIVCK